MWTLSPRKQDRGKVKDKVALKLKLTRIKASNRSDTDTDFESIAEAISAAQYIKQSISNGEDFYNMYTFVTIAADTYDELLRRKESISDYLYSRDITIKEIGLPYGRCLSDNGSTASGKEGTV